MGLSYIAAVFISPIRGLSKLTVGTVVSEPPTVAEALFGGVVGGLDVNAGALSIAVTFILTLICIVLSYTQYWFGYSNEK